MSDGRITEETEKEELISLTDFLLSLSSEGWLPFKIIFYRQRKVRFEERKKSNHPVVSWRRWVFTMTSSSLWDNFYSLFSLKKEEVHLQKSTPTKESLWNPFIFHPSFLCMLWFPSFWLLLIRRNAWYCWWTSLHPHHHHHHPCNESFVIVSLFFFWGERRQRSLSPHIIS